MLPKERHAVAMLRRRGDDAIGGAKVVEWTADDANAVIVSDWEKIII